MIESFNLVILIFYLNLVLYILGYIY